MALSGLDIYKLLPGGIKPPHPKANCKECGFPTCLAFAMKLAAKQAELAACAYVSDEAKAKLSAAAAPPIRLITLSADGRKVEVGNETVLFRHEKTFFHPTALLVRVPDTLAAGRDRRPGEGRGRLQGGLRRHGAAAGWPGGRGGLRRRRQVRRGRGGRRAGRATCRSSW